MAERSQAELEVLERGRAAAAQNDWRRALSEYLSLPSPELLTADDLEQLAWAHAWTGDLTQGVEAWERAYPRFVEEQRWAKAAIAVFWIAWWHMDKGDQAVATGWYRRLEQL
ncbi:MAG: hypothetical protein KGJ86_11480, partial [Chloroflexota bacterium]|nr:hypothetical protein [Chloroflexota bacterium]